MDEQTGGAIDDAKKRPAAPTKVGIIFRTMRECDGFFDFKIYVVDVDDSNRDYREMNPVVRFKFPRVGSDGLDVLTYCIVNSTVYIFRLIYRLGSGAPPDKKKSAYKLVLSPEDLASAEVKEVEQLTSIPDMCHAKGSPVALPTPDGKQILVFSTWFYFKDSFEAFEVLNVDDDSWVTLPKLPCPYCDSNTNTGPHTSWCMCKEVVLDVNAYSFIGKSVFYLETGMAAFALDLVKKEWTRVDILLGAADGCTRYLKTGYLETVKGRYAIMPGGKPVYNHDGTPHPDSHPTLEVYDFGDDGIYGPKRDDDAHPLAPAHVIRLSRLDPPRDSLWLKPLKPMLFPLRPQDEETACCFVVQQLEGEQPYDGDSKQEEMQQVEGPVEAEEEFVDMRELGLDFQPEPDVYFVTMEEPKAEELEEDFEEIYDSPGERRILIQVCRIDLKSSPLKFNVSNAVSVHIRFQIEPEDVSLFTL